MKPTPNYTKVQPQTQSRNIWPSGFVRPSTLFDLRGMARASANSHSSPESAGRFPSLFLLVKLIAPRADKRLLIRLFRRLRSCISWGEQDPLSRSEAGKDTVRLDSRYEEIHPSRTRLSSGPYLTFHSLRHSTLTYIPIYLPTFLICTVTLLSSTTCAASLQVQAASSVNVCSARRDCRLQTNEPSPAVPLPRRPPQPLHHGCIKRHPVTRSAQ